MGSCCVREPEPSFPKPPSPNPEQNASTDLIRPSPIRKSKTHRHLKSRRDAVSPEVPARRSKTPTSEVLQATTPALLSAVPFKKLSQPLTSIYDIKSKGVQFDYSTILLATHRDLQTVVLIMKVPRKDEGCDDEIRRRIATLGQMEHTNLLKCGAILYTETEFYGVSESFSGMRFVNYVSFAGDLEVVKDLAVQMLRGVFHAHSKGHLIKSISLPNTIFFKSHDSDRILLKLLAFGAQQKLKNCEFTSLKNQKLYMAPECREDAFTEKADVWSCGVILFILLTKSLPFAGENELELLESIAKSVHFSGKQRQKIDANAQSLITSMLNIDPQHRPTIAECLQHPWLRSNTISPPAQLQSVIVHLRKFRGGSRLKLAILSFVVMQTLGPEEKQPLQEVFDYINVSKTGLISREEMSRAFAMVNRAELAASLASEVMQKLDLNADSLMDFSEFLSATIDYSLILQPSRLNLAFHLFDPDSSGSVTLDELRSVLKYHETEKNWQKFLSEFDEDNSGNVGKSEFERVIRQLVKDVSA